MIATFTCSSCVVLLLRRRRFLFDRPGGAETRRDRFQQRVKSVAVLRRHRKHIVRKLVKRRRKRFLHLRINFVCQYRQRFSCAPQQPRQLSIERRQPRAHVHNQQQLRRAFNGHLRLAKNFARNSGLVVRHDPARVDDFECAPLPGRRAIDAVARDPRLVGDNRAPRARQPVKNRGFADIGPANNHYRRKFFSHYFQSRGHNEPKGSGSETSTVTHSAWKQKPSLREIVGQFENSRS